MFLGFLWLFGMTAKDFRIHAYPSTAKLVTVIVIEKTKPCLNPNRRVKPVLHFRILGLSWNQGLTLKMRANECKWDVLSSIKNKILFEEIELFLVLIWNVFLTYRLNKTTLFNGEWIYGCISACFFFRDTTTTRHTREIFFFNILV